MLAAQTGSLIVYSLSCEWSSGLGVFEAAMARFGVEQKTGRGFSADKELSDIFTQLWELDENRLIPEKHYDIDLQGG